MVKQNYQVQIADERNIAKAILTNQHISLKYSTEMANHIKGRPVAKTERVLQRIMDKKEPLPLKKYVKKLGHRKGKTGVAAGKYPKRVCKAFLNLIQTVKANASNKGLDEEKLLVQHVFASQGYRRISYQPKGKIGGKRRKNKSTHLEIIVREGKGL